MSRKETSMEAIDTGRAERFNGEFVPHQTEDAGVVGRRLKSECRLDWYWDKMLLDDEQHGAGIRFRRDWETGAISVGVVGAYEQAIGGGGDFTSSQLRARDRLNRAIRYLGTVPASVIIAVCAFDHWATEWERRKGWPRKSGICLLRDALTDLAKHYGLTGGRESV